MVLSLEELQEAHGKSQRLLESLTQIPDLLADDEAWASERRSVFALLRRGLVDCITSGCLEAPIFGNRQIEDAFVFLLTLGLRSERRRDNVILCFKCLRNSESWSLVLRGSRRTLELLRQLPEAFRDDVLDAADASELSLLLGLSKKKKKKKSSKAKAEEMAPDEPVPREDKAPGDPEAPELAPERAPEPAAATGAEDFFAENSLSVSDSGVDLPQSRRKGPEDLLAENSLSVSEGVDMPRGSRTCPEDLLAENSLSVSTMDGAGSRTCQDLLTEPSLSLSIHSPEPPEAMKSPALPRAALRPPRPAATLPTTATPTGPHRSFGGLMQQSPASKPRRPGARRKDFEELGPRCPNGKPMTRELMMKEGQKRREDGSRTPTLRRLLSRGSSSPPSGADTPSGLLGRMKQKLLPSRAPTPSPASRGRGPGRDFGGGDRFGVVKSSKE